MYSDYHIHSNLSFDSDESQESVIKAALDFGMSQICFTEHQDIGWPIPCENPIIDVNKYNEIIENLKIKYSDKIKILKGVELGLTPYNLQQCNDFLDNNDFDYVIGSIHIVDNMDPYYSNFWDKYSDKDAFKLYFDTMKQCISSFDRIDTLGHMDYIVRYSPNKDLNYFVDDYKSTITDILKIIIKKNINLEINTANLAKGMNFTNPHFDILKLYKEFGGNYVAVGSDAHNACDVGFGFDKAKHLIDSLGFKIWKK